MLTEQKAVILTDRSEVYAAINGERDYQDSLGTATYGEPVEHTVGDFLVYMDDYLKEAMHTASRVWGEKCVPQVMDKLRKVIALGVACAEQHGIPQRSGWERTSMEQQVQTLEQALIDSKFVWIAGETVIDAAVRYINTNPPGLANALPAGTVNQADVKPST